MGEARDRAFDLRVIGAGPTGLACAIEAQKAGFSVVLVDKGCVCNSLFHYPSHMTFFTTSELLEIGGIPFPSTNAKPARDEAGEVIGISIAVMDVTQGKRAEAARQRIEERYRHAIQLSCSGTGCGNAHRLFSKQDEEPLRQCIEEAQAV